MILQIDIRFQPQGSNIPHAVTLIETWPLRGWQQQAQRLYRPPVAQRLAVLHHLGIMRRHAPTAERLLWLDALGRDLAEEVAR